MIAQIAGLFGSRLAPRRGRTSVRRRRPTSRPVAIESLEPRQLLAIDVAIVDNSGLSIADNSFYVTGHGYPGNLPPAANLPANTPANAELRVLDPTTPATGTFTQAAVTIDSIAVLGTTATVTTMAPHQLKAGDQVFVYGDIIDQTYFDTTKTPVATGVFTVTAATPGTTWSVGGTNPFTKEPASAGTFSFTMNGTPSGSFPQSLAIASAGQRAAAYLPKVISTSGVQGISAFNGTVTVTLSASTEANFPVGTPVSIAGVTNVGLSITTPSPSTPFANADVTQVGGGAEIKVALKNGAAHGLVPGQAFTITTTNGKFNNAAATVKNTGLVDNSLQANEFTYTITSPSADMPPDTVKTLSPTYSGLIQSGTDNFVVFISGTPPVSTTSGLTIDGNTASTSLVGRTFTVNTMPEAAGLPANAVFLARASGPSLPVPADGSITGTGGSLDSQSTFSFNGNFAVLANALSNPTLAKNQFQYTLSDASASGNGTTGSMSSAAITPLPVKSLSTNTDGQPIVVLDENIATFSSQMVMMSMTPGPTPSNPFSTPVPLGITAGKVDVANVTTPPMGVGTDGGNSVIDFMEFYYAGQSGGSTIDLSAVDSLSLPLTAQASSVTTGPSTVGVNPNIGASRGQIGNAFTTFIQSEATQQSFIAAAGFDRLLYSDPVTRNLGKSGAVVPVAASAPATLQNVQLSVATQQVANMPTTFDFATSATIQTVPKKVWPNVQVGQIVTGTGIPAQTYVTKVEAVGDDFDVTFSNAVGVATGVDFLLQTANWTATKAEHGLVPGQSFTISGTGTALDNVASFTVLTTSLTDKTLGNDAFTFTYTNTSDPFTPLFPAAATVATTNPGVIAFSATQLAVRAGNPAFAALPAKATNLEISGVPGFNNIYSVGEPANTYGLPSNMVLLTLSGDQLKPGATATGGAGTQLALPLFQAPPTVAKGQFFSLSAPKDWLSEQPALDPTVAHSSVAINDPMVSYWDATLAKFFKAGNYVNIVTGNFVPTGGTQLNITGVQKGDAPNTVKFTVSNGAVNALLLKAGDIVNVAVPGTPEDQEFFDAYNNPGTRVLAADTTSFTVAGTYNSSVPNPTSWAGIVANKMSLISYTGVSDGTQYNFTLDPASAGAQGAPASFKLPAPTPTNQSAVPLPNDPSYQSLANALWVWGQGGIPSDATGTVHDQIVMAMCRGVANDGIFKSQPTTPGASNVVWTNTDNWYTSTDPANVYCPYSKFVHFGRLDGGTDLTGTTSIYAGGLAYGFSVDETPIAADGQLLAKPVGGPSKMDGTVPDGAKVSLIVNPWVQAAPSVTGLVKTRGSVNGGTVVTISGTGFNNTSTVKFGTVAATNVTYNPASGGNPATLTATSPAQTAGTVDITVTTAAFTSAVVAADKFTYVATSTPIVFASAAPLAANAATFTIVGEHFSPTKTGNTVTLSSGTAIVQSATTTSITLLFTSQPTAGSLTATVKTGQASSGAVQVASVFATVTPATAPLAATAKTLVITGVGFNAKTPARNVVTLSSGTGVVTKATATSLTILLTSPPQPGPLTVTSISVNGVQSAPLVQVAAVVPGPASAKSTVTASVTVAAVSTAVTVTLQAIDAVGNLVTTGGARVKFAASVSGTFSKVTDNGNGTYTATYTTKRVGAQVFSATVNGLKVTDTATTAFNFSSQFSQPIPGTDWSVAVGGFRPNLNIAYATGAKGVSVALYRGAAARNVTVSANVSNLENLQFGGVVARYSSQTSYYRAGLVLESGQYYAVIKAVGLTGVRVLAKQSVVGVGEGLVSFRLNGNLLSLSLNGTQVAQVTDSRFQSGSVGISGSQTVGFTNFFAG